MKDDKHPLKLHDVPLPEDVDEDVISVNKNKKPKRHRQGTVILVAPTYAVVDIEGNNQRIKGGGFKVGDKIDIP